MMFVFPQLDNILKSIQKNPKLDSLKVYLSVIFGKGRVFMRKLFGDVPEELWEIIVGRECGFGCLKRA